MKNTFWLLGILLLCLFLSSTSELRGGVEPAPWVPIKQDIQAFQREIQASRGNLASVKPGAQPNEQVLRLSYQNMMSFLQALKMKVKNLREKSQDKNTKALCGNLSQKLMELEPIAMNLMAESQGNKRPTAGTIGLRLGNLERGAMMMQQWVKDAETKPLLLTNPANSNSLVAHPEAASATGPGISASGSTTQSGGNAPQALPGPQIISPSHLKETPIGIKITPPVTIAGYVLDDHYNGVPGIKMTATVPHNPTPYVAWTDSSGHYALSVPSPFTGQLKVNLSNPCFGCQVIAVNLVNQATDILAQNFYCLTTVVVVGTIQTQFRENIKGVVLNGLPGNPVTDEYGFYRVTVNCGWSGTVTPIKTGWNFSPPSRIYEPLAQNPPHGDYVGFAIGYQISGYVRTSTGQGIAGVKLNGLYPTSLDEYNVTDANGHYFVRVSYGWSGTVTPVKAGYSFSPASKTYANLVAQPANQDYLAQ